MKYNNKSFLSQRDKYDLISLIIFKNIPHLIKEEFKVINSDWENAPLFPASSWGGGGCGWSLSKSAGFSSISSAMSSLSLWSPPAPISSISLLFISKSSLCWSFFSAAASCWCAGWWESSWGTSLPTSAPSITLNRWKIELLKSHFQ